MKKCIDEYIKQIKEAWIDLKTPGSRIKQLPNILTSVRLLSPFVIIPMVATGNLLIAGLSTLFFSTTDLLDGFIARKLKITSELGKDLDAVTDKVFVGTLIASLLFTNITYILPLILETVIASINVYKKVHNQRTGSTMMGKVKITFLYLLIATGFINMYIPVSHVLTGILYGSTIGLQTLTLRDYCKEASRNLQTIKSEDTLEISKEESILEEKCNKKFQIEKYKTYKELLEQQQRLEELNTIKEKDKIKKLKK